MHEMSLADSLLRLALDAAKAQKAKRILIVRLEIGALAAVEPESLAFCFDVLKKGSLAEDARLEILRPLGRAYCPACAQEIEIARRHDPCPGCGGFRLEVRSGAEMKIKELEVA